MPVSIPNFSDVGFATPRAVGGTPSFPQEDPGAQAEGVLGAGLQKAGQAAETVGAYSQMARNKLETAYASADVRDRLSQLNFAVKNETDPAKITQLRDQFPTAITASAGAITDPNARQLWLVDHQPLASEGQVAADQRGLDVWRGNYSAGIGEKINNASQRAAQSDDPAAHEAEAQNISDLVDAGVGAGVIHPEKALDIKRQAAQAIVTGHADWLDANGHAQQALDFVHQHGGALPAPVLENYTHRLETRADQQGGQALADRVRDSGLATGGAIPQAIVAEAEQQNVDPATALATADIESGMGRNLGSRGNIFQLGQPEWESVGGGPMGEPATDIRNGVAFIANTKSQLARKLGREPTGAETYLAHQQGVDGAVKLLSNPDQPAGKLVGKAAIALNGGDPDAPASAFVDKWRRTYEHRAQAYSGATLPGTGDSAGAGGSDLPAGGVVTDPTLAAQINAAPESGEPIPLDQVAQPPNPKAQQAAGPPLPIDPAQITAGSLSAGQVSGAGAPPIPDLDQQLRDIDAAPNISQKQKDIAAAIVTRDYQRQKAATASAMRQEVASVKGLMKDDEASIATTGQPVADLTSERVSAALGPDAADEFSANRSTAYRYFQQTSDFENLPQAEIDERLNAMRPSPGQVGFARNLKAYDAAQKRADDLAKLRATDPAAAVSGLPDVQAAAKGATLEKPETMAPLVKARMVAMERIGIPEENRVPITRAGAQLLWQPIGLASRGGDPREIKAALTATVERVQAAFGDQAQPALEAVLREGKADHDTAGIAASIVRKLARNDIPAPGDARAFDDAQKTDASQAAVDPLIVPQGAGQLTEQPSVAAPPPIPAASPRPAPDAQAINMLRQSPETASQFDAVYGAGQAEKALAVAPARSTR